MPAFPEAQLDERRTPRGRETAERILDAAEAVFADKGYAGTTLRDVAERVGIRIPSLYNHFPNKESLYAAVLERGIGPVLDALGEFAAQGAEIYREPGPLIERMMTLLGERPNLPRLVMHEALGGGQHLTPLLRDWLGPALAHADQMVAAGPARDRWEKEQLPLLAATFFNIVVGYFAIAPLYRDLQGSDLLAKENLRAQTRLLRELSLALFAPAPPNPAERAD